jgi:hypothetical protein
VLRRVKGGLRRAWERKKRLESPGSREVVRAGWTRPYSRWWPRGGPAQRGAHAGRRTEMARTGTNPRRSGAMQEEDAAAALDVRAL